MKIIKEGNPKTRANVVRRFECQTCGCIFDANGNEYEVDEWYMKDVNRNKTIILRAWSACPMCDGLCANYIHAEYERP